MSIWTYLLFILPGHGLQVNNPLFMCGDFLVWAQKRGNWICCMNNDRRNLLLYFLTNDAKRLYLNDSARHFSRSVLVCQKCTQDFVSNQVVMLFFCRPQFWICFFFRLAPKFESVKAKRFFYGDVERKFHSLLVKWNWLDVYLQQIHAASFREFHSGPL